MMKDKTFILFREEDVHRYNGSPEDVEYRRERRIEKSGYNADEWSGVVIDKSNEVDLHKLSKAYWKRISKREEQARVEREKETLKRLKEKYEK